MNTEERIKMVKAMELICRNLNDEGDVLTWLTEGVADGDIEYGDLSIKETDAEDLADYIEDDDAFADLMDTFLFVMKQAHRSGGLCCDNVVSKEEAP